MTPSEKARRYAEEVAAGKIPAGRYVRLACERFLKDLARTDWPYVYDAELADRYVRFAELMPHVKGKWSAKKERVVFEPWQCFTECNLFGWVNAETRKRRFRESYEEIPRKNAKSTKAAIRGLYLLCADGEAGAEVYSGATTEKQAHEIFKPAWLMAQKSPGLCSRFGIELSGNAKNPGPIFVMSDMSKFEPIIGKPGDGASPHAALIDEYHEHDSDHMLDAMKTGMGAREQPLLSMITTAGTNLGGPCYDKRRDVISILEGAQVDEGVFGLIYCLDEGDAWDDPANLRKANPNFGVSVFADFLESQLAQARRSAVRQNSFRTKHLNEWVGAKTAWMNMLAWQKQQRDIKIDDFMGCPCWIAVDLTSKKDIASVTITFLKNGCYYSFWKFFAPEAAADENDKYREFATAGWLELTNGSMIDQEVIEEYVVTLAKKFSANDVAFDEWQADYMMVRIMARGVKAVKYPFNTRNVSEPMKHMEALILSGRYFHDGNPVMTWMVGNVAARIDVRGNIFPNKERPNDPRCKIDGVATGIMALGRALLEPEKEKDYQIFFV